MSESHTLSRLYHCPSLMSITADVAVRTFIYEDAECNFYRWDPIKIWQFENAKPKKKPKERDFQDSLVMPLPSPPWKGIKKFSTWYWEESGLGSTVSNIRIHVNWALEKRSWHAKSEEEDMVFWLLKLCIDPCFSIKRVDPDIPSKWCPELAKIFASLEPLPTLRLHIKNDIFCMEGHFGKDCLVSLLKSSPHLQSFQINDWDVSNEILRTLGRCCPDLCEFSITGMKSDVFMNDVGFFACFFNGSSPDDVTKCYRENTLPSLSFHNLKFVDMLYCKQLENFIHLLLYFYPLVCFGELNANVLDEKCILSNELCSDFNVLKVTCRTHSLLDHNFMKMCCSSSVLSEFRLQADDNCMTDEEEDSEEQFIARIEEAADNLRKVFSSLKMCNSFALKPHQSVMLPLLISPLFADHGKRLTSLNIQFEFDYLNCQYLELMINNCPNLQHLFIAFQEAHNEDVARLDLIPLPYLENFIFRDYVCHEKWNDCISFPRMFFAVTSSILKVASNLKFVGLSASSDTKQFLCCPSDSEDNNGSTKDELIGIFHPGVSEVYLSFVLEEDIVPDSALLQILCCHFPNLKTLYLSTREDGTWKEYLSTLKSGNIRVTLNPPEFVNCFSWNSDLRPERDTVLYAM